jgi:ABC-2 type transport system ATP-binding protein
MDNPPPEEELAAIPGVTGVELLNDRSIRLRFKASSAISKQIVTMSVQRGWELKEITLEKSSLDEVFAQLSTNQKR